MRADREAADRWDRTAALRADRTVSAQIDRGPVRPARRLAALAPGVLLALALGLGDPAARAQTAAPRLPGGPADAVADGRPVPEVSVDEAARRLAGGGWAVLMRHAATEPGTGDPPGYALADCASQRNLSAAGRAGAAATGQALRARGVRFDEVRSSAWCRCLDTARLGFGEPVRWAPLDSFFDAPARGPAQTAEVLADLQRLAAPRNLLLVTHQVNITALTGVYPALGELVAVRWRDGAARAEMRFRVVASEILR